MDSPRAAAVDPELAPVSLDDAKAVGGWRGGGAGPEVMGEIVGEWAGV